MHSTHLKLQKLQWLDIFDNKEIDSIAPEVKTPANDIGDDVR